MSKSAVLILVACLFLRPFELCAFAIEEGVLKDIRSAQGRLDKMQKNISQLRLKLATRIRKLENEVADLREQAGISQRLQDEKTFSLQQLQKRLKSWREQSQFQQDQLMQFIRTNSINQADIEMDQPGLKGSFEEQINRMTKFIETLNQRLYPSWQRQKVLMSDGEITMASILSLGPVSWYLTTKNEKDESHSGFLNREKNWYKVVLELPKSAVGEMEKLLADGAGSLFLDPSLTKAIKISKQKVSLIQYIKMGGIWIFPILAFAVIAVLIAAGKAIQLLRLPIINADLVEELATSFKRVGQGSLQEKNENLHWLEKASGMQKSLIKIALETDVGQKRDDKLYSKLLDCKNYLEYWLGAVAVIAAVSPLLGLLGTVSGMIQTFKLMTIFGAGDPAAVSGGISQALVTTEFGLVVAIPALLLHALLSRKVKSYYAQLESCSVNLSQLKTGQ